MIRLKRHFISSLIILGLCSCAGLRMIERPQATSSAVRQGAQWYEVLWQRDQAIQTLRASARVRVSSGIFSRAVEQALIVKRPKNMRLDSYTVLGNLIHQLVLRNGSLWVYDATRERFDKDRDAERLLEENLGLGLSIDDMVSILVGSVPLEERTDYLAVTKKQGDVLRGLNSQVLIDPQTQLPQRFSGYTRHNELYEVRYSHYREVAGISFPHRIAVALHEPRISLEISFKDVDINIPVSDEKFAHEVH